MKAIPHFRGGLLLLIILLFSVPVTQLFAQGQVYRHLTTRDGLPSGYVWHMMQDRHGFIWTSTNSGFSKYDGYTFTNYQPDPDAPSSISSSLIYTARELDSGRFVVGTSVALDVFDPATEVFRSVRLPGNVPQITFARDVHVTDNGDVWVAARDGLYHLSGHTLLADTATVEFHALPEALAPEQFSGFTALAHDGRNTLWFPTPAGLVFHPDTRSFTKVDIPIPEGAILNLCNNAFDAMRSGLSGSDTAYKPRLAVRTQKRAGTAAQGGNGNAGTQEGAILVEIEDNGPGIPDEIRDKILQPFFTTKKGTQGTGLGLSITNDIVKAHGGELSVKSVAGKSAVFSIILPANKA